jgi:hypothetical protein
MGVEYNGMPQYFGELSLPNLFSPLEWHIHEMIYGYMAAVLAGFLLTAIPPNVGARKRVASPLVSRRRRATPQSQPTQKMHRQS